jgi:hypothetical protein
MKADAIQPVITNSTELRHAMMRLNSLKEDQETELRRHLKEIYYSLQLSTVIRRTVKDIGADKDIKASALQTGISIGSGFILDKLLLRKGYGIKSYLLNLGIKKVISYFTSGHSLKNLLNGETKA